MAQRPTDKVWVKAAGQGLMCFSVVVGLHCEISLPRDKLSLFLKGFINHVILMHSIFTVVCHKNEIVSSNVSCDSS